MLAFQCMERSPNSKLSGTVASLSGGKLFSSRSVPAGDAAPKRSGERGAGNLKAIIWTMILVAFIYVVAMILPILINEYQFQDSVQDIARFASINRKTNEQIQKAVLDEAQKEDLPVEAEDIKVQSQAGNVHINVDYSVTVDLKVYQWTLNFHPTASNSALL
jgi:cell division protein FtsL